MSCHTLEHDTESLELWCTPQSRMVAKAEFQGTDFSCLSYLLHPFSVMVLAGTLLLKNRLVWFQEGALICFYCGLVQQSQLSGSVVDLLACFLIDLLVSEPLALHLHASSAMYELACKIRSYGRGEEDGRHSHFDGHAGPL
jgi:hypothetical protein